MPSTWTRFRPFAGLLHAGQVAVLAAEFAEAGQGLVLAGAGDLEAVAPGPGPLDRTLLARLSAAGLRGHTVDREAARVLCSPLSGRHGGHLDAWPLAVRLERALHGRPGAGEPGGHSALVVGLDDGSADIDGLGLRMVFIARGPSEFSVLLDGVDLGVPLRAGESEADLADWLAVIEEHAPRRRPQAAARAETIGWLEHATGPLVTLGAAVPGGVLDARQLQFLAALERPVVLTPWRTLLLCDLDEWAAEQVVRVLAPLGFVFDAESPVVADLASGTGAA